ncbi:hypothetical protein BDZ89DRAFT_1117054 [Hymenopellis radicata]|nr:hypothetical protein BDZ89DRAFT_1117054 [Hymenopellis radicata]
MKDYQLHGLSFLVNMYTNGMNCILGDEYLCNHLYPDLRIVLVSEKTCKRYHCSRILSS